MNRSSSVCTAVVLLLLLVGIAPARADASDHPERLRVTRAVVDVDRQTVLLHLRCQGSRASCAGLLSLRVEAGTITHRRRVRLTPGRGQRVTLRIRSGGLRMREQSLGPGEDIVLRSRKARTVADVFLQPRLTCRSGEELAVSDTVRLFGVEGFGLYACALPGGRPRALTEAPEDDWSPDPRPTTAGRYVAFVRSRGSSQCTLREIVVVDVSTGREVRTPRTTQFEPARDACSGPSPRALVLRASGAVAWTEPPADGSTVLVRAADASGERVLARGPAIDPASLVSVDGATVGWLDAGQRRTAPLG